MACLKGSVREAVDALLEKMEEWKLEELLQDVNLDSEGE